MRGRSAVPYPISRRSNRHLIGFPLSLSDLVSLRALFRDIFTRHRWRLFIIRSEKERETKNVDSLGRIVGPRRASRPISDYEGKRVTLKAVASWCGVNAPRGAPKFRDVPQPGSIWDEENGRETRATRCIVFGSCFERLVRSSLRFAFSRVKRF